jgi:hypothetical protein
MILLNTSLPKFLETYDSDDACLDAISATKWPHGFLCQYCGHDDACRLSRPRTMQCSSCRRQSSITANTIFQDSHIPLTSWFLAIYLVANDNGGISSVRLAELLGVNRKSTDLMLAKLRIAMGDRDKNLTLAGYIELDEAFLGGRSRSKRLGKSQFEGKIQVLVMIESENMEAGNLVLTVLPDMKIDTLKDAVAERVDNDPGGHLFRADGLGKHHVLRTLGHHVNMSIMTKAQLDTSMACLSLAISHLKRFFKGTYHHFCKKRVQDYLDEFCYRWNRRQFKTRKVTHLITACTLHPAAPAKFTKRPPALFAVA